MPSSAAQEAEAFKSSKEWSWNNDGFTIKLTRDGDIEAPIQQQPDRSIFICLRQVRETRDLFAQVPARMQMDSRKRQTLFVHWKRGNL